jgi:predicted DNA binding protein
MREIQLGIHHTGCPLSQISQQYREVSIKNLCITEVDNKTSKRLIYLYGDNEQLAEFRETFQNHPSVLEFRRVTANYFDRFDYYSTKIKYSDDHASILDVFNSFGAYQQGVVPVDSGIEKWTIYTEEKFEVGNLITELERAGNKVKLFRNSDIGDLTEGDYLILEYILMELTERQQSVFQAALELGYYNEEAEITLEDISDELDLHFTTVAEHLDKAENTMLTFIGERLF